MDDFNALSPIEKARNLREQSREARREGRDDLSHAYATQSLHLFQGCGDRHGEAEMLVTLADLALHFNPTGEDGFARRRRLCEEALAIYETIDDPLGRARALRLIAPMLPPDEARRSLEESLRIARESGDTGAIAASLERIGAHLAMRHPKEARRYRNEALEISRRSGDRLAVAQALFGRSISFRGEDQEQARKCVEEALQIYRELGRKKQVAEMLMFLPGLCESRQDELQYTSECRDVCREIGVRSWEASCIRRLARFAEEEGDAARAGALREEADVIFPEEPLDPEMERRLQAAFEEAANREEEDEPDE